MRYEWLDEYLLSLPGAEKDYKPEWGWFRYMVQGKLFAAVCSPGPEHKTYGGHDLVNLKCDPQRSELLRELCAASHRLVVEKLPKYVQRELTKNRG